MDTPETNEVPVEETVPSAPEPQPQAKPKMPKEKLTEIIVNAVVVGLLVLSCIFTIFLPVVRYSTEHFENYSANLSPMDMLSYLIGGLKGSESEEFIAAFEENDGRGLLSWDKEKATTRRGVATEEQIKKDVAFKRERSDSSALDQWQHVAFMESYITSWVGASADEDALDELGGLTEAEKQELQAQMAATKSQGDALYPAVDLLIDDVTAVNFAGLKQFLRASVGEYVSDTLTAEKFAEYKETYLISDISYEEFTEVLKDKENAGNLLVATAFLPGYADSFKLYPNGNEYTVSTDNTGTSTANSMPTIIFGIALVIVAICELCLAIPVVFRLLRIIKDMPRKAPKKKKKFIAKYPILYVAGVTILFIVVAFVFAILQLEAPFVGGFAGASVVTLLANIGIIAAEVYAMKLAAKNPNPVPTAKTEE